ncbi:MAG: alpha-amylase [Chloroflexi bacterium]|nr:MAG: alpha-amylase [Chloroflexota bacterium]
MSLPMEFHVSREARDRYSFDDTLFSISGNVIFANFHNARLFAQKMNSKRDLINFPEQAVRAGQINAMGLLDEILHLVVGLYREQRNPDAFDKAIDWLNTKIGNENVDRLLRNFVEEFPPVSVYRREVGIDDYLNGETQDSLVGKVSNKQIALEEMLMLWMANMNPAFAPFLELFDDAALEKDPTYLNAIHSLYEFFDIQPHFGPDNQNLVDLLRAPALAYPHSLTDQLEFIRQRWGGFIGKYIYRLLSSLDLIREEEKVIFPGHGPGPSRVYEFRGMELEAERFSQDKDWMPNLTMLAKNAYVWLDQLSKKYQRSIKTLDEIPEAELEYLSRSGFTGLWLIGLWERSQASKQIKQLRGNPEAVASAYSLFEYQIAHDLGGDSAYQVFRDRAWKKGIRLASDMVPNHMGIDSRWVIEHPNWFIGLDYSPFPSYSFTGPNLSWDQRVGVYIEDHYYNNTDAAVVFKRADFWTGSERFIYHGNDGTSMPWNDTAQLDYLNPEVREAVIQTILSVARKFPIIRFDAAMTLAKKHYQRLWYPEPGTGGAIPSRAEYGLTKDQLDAAMPEEFWREVVDRVAQEVPDTLLLAEAFWLMEGYFVRTLGMHRVYNSAFMNMLRDEKNAEYRLTIKNTMEFDPEILKRYVNFMNNPDERTAVDQFGKGDKYFGVAIMMATMPGLPMFGHGQVEGYTEKYGMEYKRAYWDETPDPYLQERHDREVFPILRKRYMFADVKDFLLYDFFTPEGHVNEDVFAYSNRSGAEASLVIYQNKFATAKGWIRTSAGFSVKSESGDRIVVQRTLGEGLALEDGEDVYTIFRDRITGLEYIRSNRELHEKGLYIELDAYKYHVFVEFLQVHDNEWNQYSQLASYLNGRGVPSVDEAVKEIFLQPILQPYHKLLDAEFISEIIDHSYAAGQTEPESLEEVLDQVYDRLIPLLEEIKLMTQADGEVEPIAADILESLNAVLRLPAVGSLYPYKENSLYQEALTYMEPAVQDDPVVWGPLLAWVFTRDLGRVASVSLSTEDARDISRSWIDEWLFGKGIASMLVDMKVDEGNAWRGVARVKLMIQHSLWCENKDSSNGSGFLVLQDWLRDSDVQQFIGTNRYQGVLWYNKESFDDMLWWMFHAAVVDILTESKDGSGQEVVSKITDCYELVKKLRDAEALSEYKLDKMIELVKS